MEGAHENQVLEYRSLFEVCKKIVRKTPSIDGYECAYPLTCNTQSLATKAPEDVSSVNFLT